LYKKTRKYNKKRGGFLNFLRNKLRGKTSKPYDPNDDSDSYSRDSQGNIKYDIETPTMREATATRNS